MKCSSVISALVCFLAFACHSVHAQTQQVTLTATADTYLDEANPGSNYGAEQLLFVGPQGSAGSNKDLVALVKFNVALSNIPGIPAGSTITGAFLNLYLNIERSASPSAYRATLPNFSPATETSVSWNSGWSGDLGVTGSRVASSPNYYQFNVLSIVQSWYTGSTTYYNGFLIAAAQDQGTANTYHSFYSREGSYPPQLVIRYNPPCSYSINPTSASYGSSAGSGSVSISAASACSWAASSNVSWITITSGSSGSGNGTVQYSVASNPNTSSRNGTITIAGETFTVTQSGISPPPSSDSVSVVFIANTATVPDVLLPTSFVQIRGSTPGLGSWTENSKALLKNIGGDYWRGAFTFKKGERVEYKYFTNARSTLTSESKNQGWEQHLSGPTINRVLDVGQSDTTLPLEFVNGSPTTQPQYWRPYVETSSIEVHFRINMAANQSFDKNRQFVAIRGGTAPLSWETNFLLNPEDQHGNLGSRQYDGTNFWSGTVSFPASAFNSTIEYKFVTLNEKSLTANVVTWEENITPSPDVMIGGYGNRFITSNSNPSDTTIYWKWWTNVPTAVEHYWSGIPSAFSLELNYPNPFNPSTVIEFGIPTSALTTLTIFNVLGQPLITLVSNVLPAGIHRARWDASAFPTGPYFYQLKSGSFTLSKKLILVR